MWHNSFLLGSVIFSTLFTQPPGAEVTGQVLMLGKPVRDAVVYLEGAPKPSPLPKAVVDQRNKTFVPHVLVVTVGTTVEFPNNDVVLHNVFAYYEAKRFDLGMYRRGTSRSVTFDKPGIVALLCNIHPDMSAYIFVVDTPYYALTDKNGQFRIRSIVPGTYTLRVWHESGAALSQKVTLKGNEAYTLSLALKGK
ncbi:MAG: carboxypeptidase regulatory-like domain-containing protein [Chthonomonadetes bacterium]|nr:carboxypeptidase regulatory-like domain-containing protein [Chthonomonadetes bacterium]